MEDSHDDKPELIPYHKPTGNYGTGTPDGSSLPGISRSNHSVTSTDALVEIQRRAQKHLPLYPKILDELPTVKIFNVWSEVWTIHKGSLGTFTIQAREKGKAFSAPLEIPGIVREASAYGFDDAGTKFQWFLYDGHDVAADIIGTGKFCHPPSSLTRYGVFIAKGDAPTAEELAEAHSQLHKTCSQMVREIAAIISEEWSGAVLNVSDMHMKALEYIRKHGGKLTA